MAGTGGIGGGSVKVWLQDSNQSVPSSAQAAGGPPSRGRGRADASVGNPGTPSITITFKLPNGSILGAPVTLQPGEEVKFDWQ